MKRLTFPLRDRRILQGLQPWEEVLIDGILVVARDQAHKRLTELMAASEPLPVQLEGAAIYYAGPSPAPPGMPVGSCGPTTSSRMDPFTPALLKAGVAALIGKGPRSPEVWQAMIQHGATYFQAFGGCGALYASVVSQVQTAAFPELGPEALRLFHVTGFPVLAVPPPSQPC